MSLPLRDRPVFICGHPKSGTSLLRALLDSHPQLVVFPEETVFFREFLPLAGDRPLQELGALAERKLIHIFEWNQEQPPPSQRGFPDRDYSHVSYQAVCQALGQQLAENVLRHPGDVLCAAVLAYGQACGLLTERSARWVEKSPYNEYYAAQIFAWWPEARCVHIVRDPRDNHLTYRRKHPEWSPEAFAESWSRSTAAGLENQQRFGTRRYKMVTYEHLVNDPGEVLDALRAFLGIEPDDSLGLPTRAGEPWAGNSMFALQFQGISTASVGRWAEGLTPAEARVIEMIAGPLMQVLGYTAGKQGLALGRLRLIRWRLHKALFGSRPGRKESADPPKKPPTFGGTNRG